VLRQKGLDGTYIRLRQAKLLDRMKPNAKAPMILTTKTGRAFKNTLFHQTLGRGDEESCLNSVDLPGLDELVAVDFHDSPKWPADLYTASPRLYRSLPELDYPFHDRDILVTACGRICMHRKKINISTVLAGQKLGIEEVDEGIWLVSFMNYDLGYIDLEQRTLQTIDNPFGTRLSPMS